MLSVLVQVQWDYMAYVKDEPTPNLDPSSFSEEIVGFIDCCLQKEQRHRPSAHRMMEHPFLAAHDAARLTVVRDPGMGCELLQVKLTEEIVLSFVEHYYETLRGEPATLHELYADGSACTVGESSCHGPEEISRCLEETFGGAWLIDPDCGRVTLQALEGGAQGFVATVPGSLLLRGDGEEGRPREFSDELRIVAVEQSLWVETATHRWWE